MELLEQVQKRAMKLIRGLEDFHYEDTQEFGANQLEKRRLHGDLTAISERDLQGGGHFIRNCSDGTRGNEYKLKEGKFRLDTGKTFFTVRVVRYWNMLSREVMDVLTLAVFEARLDKALSLPMAVGLGLDDM
ncbi:hypothetical protein WISP_146131 [Willisornis vidua]|uniref:Uncharacterized protein n=1 Tax=Willisornis vidua TaxID=1566151 RepID=A0ABQ9CQH3_9PASS|nr:hypothetical protein WISP_146131 [Willisornis vidua]